MDSTQEERIQQYLQVLGQLDEPLGDWRKGEIQIINDPDEIKICEAILRERCAANGLPAHFAETGVLYEDPYVIGLRDPVLFPPKKHGGMAVYGSYIRIVYLGALRQQLSLAMLVVDAKKRIVLNRTFRHGRRGWAIEIPGTITRDGETSEDALARCIRTDLGACSITRAPQIISSGFTSERGIMGGGLYRSTS